MAKKTKRAKRLEEIKKASERLDGVISGFDSKIDEIENARKAAVKVMDDFDKENIPFDKDDLEQAMCEEVMKQMQDIKLIASNMEERMEAYQEDIDNMTKEVNKIAKSMTKSKRC